MGSEERLSSRQSKLPLRGKRHQRERAVHQYNIRAANQFVILCTSYAQEHYNHPEPSDLRNQATQTSREELQLNRGAD